MYDMDILAKINDSRVMEISKTAYEPLLLMLFFFLFFSVGCGQKTHLCSFGLKNTWTIFFQLEITTKKVQKKKVLPQNSHLKGVLGFSGLGKGGPHGAQKLKGKASIFNTVLSLNSCVEIMPGTGGLVSGAL